MDPFYLALLLYIAALVLAFVDLFVPSGGVLIILGGLAATACVLLGFRSSQTMGMVMLTLVVASIPAFAILAINIWPKTPIGKRVILGPPKNRAAGDRLTERKSEFVGLVVTAESPLMPAGQLRIDGKRYNAVSEGEIIEPGQNVEVIDVRERSLIVRVTSAECTVGPLAPAADEAKLSEDDENNGAKLLERPADELGLDSID
jgi:membrane-bound ClpP family serine protease